MIAEESLAEENARWQKLEDNIVKRISLVIVHKVVDVLVKMEKHLETATERLEEI